jgi:hypothetical protein
MDAAFLFGIGCHLDANGKSANPHAVAKIASCFIWDKIFSGEGRKK